MNNVKKKDAAFANINSYFETIRQFPQSSKVPLSTESKTVAKLIKQVTVGCRYLKHCSKTRYEYLVKTTTSRSESPWLRRILLPFTVVNLFSKKEGKIFQKCLINLIPRHCQSILSPFLLETELLYSSHLILFLFSLTKNTFIEGALRLWTTFEEFSSKTAFSRSFIGLKLRDNEDYFFFYWWLAIANVWHESACPDNRW